MDTKEGGVYPDSYGIRIILRITQKGSGSKKAFNLTRDNGLIHVGGISEKDLINKVTETMERNGIELTID